MLAAKYELSRIFTKHEVKFYTKSVSQKIEMVDKITVKNGFRPHFSFFTIC